MKFLKTKEVFIFTRSKERKITPIAIEISKIIKFKPHPDEKDLTQVFLLDEDWALIDVDFDLMCELVSV